MIDCFKIEYVNDLFCFTISIVIGIMVAYCLVTLVSRNKAIESDTTPIEVKSIEEYLMIDDDSFSSVFEISSNFDSVYTFESDEALTSSTLETGDDAEHADEIMNSSYDFSNSSVFSEYSF